MKRKFVIVLCFLFMTLFVSCKAADTSDIPADIEVVNNTGATDRILYENLQRVESDATIIVEGVAKDTLGQKVSSSYDYGLQKELPRSGFTKREFEVTKVYKGDVETGDTVVLLQDYYIWTDTDDSSEKQQLITTSYLKPAVKDKEYLLFLIYDDRNDGYWPVCDYEGMFSIPTDQIKTETEAETLKQLELDVYDYDEDLRYLMPIYNEVVAKYFSSDQD